MDDLTADAAGTACIAPMMVSVAGQMLCEGIEALGLQLSTGKCKVLSTSVAAGRIAVNSLSRWKVVLAAHAKALGAGVAAGARRATHVQKGRWAALVARLHRLAILLRATVSVARLFRSGIGAAITYGDDVVGVATATLERRRRTVAAAVSGSTGGRSVDMILVLADDSHSQHLGPAFDAHVLPPRALG